MHSCQMLSQIKTDTLNIGKNIIIISYPEKSKVNITYYEEGFFEDITCIVDTAIIGFHYGGMLTIPLINRQGKNITSEYVIANDLHQTRGFYYSKGEKKFFREDNVNKHRLDFYYTDVPEEKLLLYESLLNSIKYLDNKDSILNGCE